MAKHAIDLSFYQSGRINIASFSRTNGLDAYRQIPEDYFPFLCLRVRAGGFVVSWLLPLSLLFIPGKWMLGHCFPEIYSGNKAN
jgi:hypothetical protein